MTAAASAGIRAAATHDWAGFIARKNDEIARLNGIYARLLTGSGCTMFDARAVFIDPHTLDVGGQRVTAERIVIAVGGHPLRPDMPGCELGIVSDEAFFLPALPKHVMMIGAGYIAVEFAGIFAGLGSQVELVCRPPLPLRGFDGDMREALAEALRHQGVILHCGTAPAKVEQDAEGYTVHLQDGTVRRTDLVFWAVGRRPNTRNLGLEAAGVHTTSNGAVVVNEQHESSQPHIYAIGDVSNHLNLTPVAIAEGHALADRLFSPQRRHWNFDRGRDGGVQPPADGDGRADGGGRGGAVPGGHLPDQVHADAAHPDGSPGAHDDEAGGGAVHAARGRCAHAGRRCGGDDAGRSPSRSRRGPPRRISTRRSASIRRRPRNG